MNGQISLLNAIAEKEPQTNNTERQTLPKGHNAFALLMAGSHSTKSVLTSKSVEKHHADADKGKEVIASDEHDSSDKKTKASDSKNTKKALDDVLPQLSVKDTPLTVSKDISAQTVSTKGSAVPTEVTPTVDNTDAQSSVKVSEGQNEVDTDAIVNVPVQTDGNATLPSTSTVSANSSGSDVSTLEADEVDSSNQQSAMTFASSITTSSTTSALPVDDQSSSSVDPQENGKVVSAEVISTNTNSAQGTDAEPIETAQPVQALNGNKKAEAPVNPEPVAPLADAKNALNVANFATDTPATKEVVSEDKKASPVPGQSNSAENKKANATHSNIIVNAVDTDQASATVKPVQGVINQAAPSAQGTTPTAPIADKSQVAVASQYTGNQVASNVNSASSSSNASSSVTTSSSDGLANAQAGQQSGGQQSSSQNGQGNQASQGNLLNQFIQSQMQAHQSVLQQAAVKHFNDLSMGTGSATADASKLLGNLGLDNKGQLPPGMQGIVYSLRSPQWSQALGQRMVYMANNKIQEAKITLNPEKLGPVQIKLHLDKNQQVHVAMSAHHHLTKETMDAAIPKLKEMFGEAGIDLGSIDVSQDSQFEAQQQSNEQDNRQGRSVNSSFAVDESEHEATHAIIKRTDSLIDYYA